MPESCLVLTLPVGNLTATSLGVAGYALHQRPGSGKHFIGHTVFAQLRPLAEFEFLDEGSWRAAADDAAMALRATDGGKKTKTALSNNALLTVPISAFSTLYLGKTGGELLALAGPTPLGTFGAGDSEENMTPADVAAAIGQPMAAPRTPRLYMVLAPVQFLVLSSLTPTEYTWYATHRAGKCFRQVVFTELAFDPPNLVNQGRFHAAREELVTDPDKKTKTVVNGEIYNHVPFESWVGYDGAKPGGLYVGDRSCAQLWRFPQPIPFAWNRAH